MAWHLEQNSRFSKKHRNKLSSLGFCHRFAFQLNTKLRSRRSLLQISRKKAFLKAVTVSEPRLGLLSANFPDLPLRRTTLEIVSISFPSTESHVIRPLAKPNKSPISPLNALPTLDILAFFIPTTSDSAMRYS